MRDSKTPLLSPTRATTSAEPSEGLTRRKWLTLSAAGAATVVITPWLTSCANVLPTKEGLRLDQSSPAVRDQAAKLTAWAGP